MIPSRMRQQQPATTLLACERGKGGPSGGGYLCDSDGARRALGSSGSARRPGVMKAAEKGAGPRVCRTHKDLVGGSMLGDHPGVHEQHMVSDVAGKCDLVRYDNHRRAVFAELPHDREHLADEFGI